MNELVRFQSALKAPTNPPAKLYVQRKRSTTASKHLRAWKKYPNNREKKGEKKIHTLTRSKSQKGDIPNSNTD